MKFILCSVCLAHGAVVYTVLTPFSVGLYQDTSQQNCELHVVLDKGNSEEIKKKQQTITTTKDNPTKYSEFKRFQEKNRGSQSDDLSSSGNQFTGKASQQDGWQMEGDFSIYPPHDITIHFTVDAQSRISNVQITPFSSTLHSLVCEQLKHIKFIWRSPSPPPTNTTFEKKIHIL